MLRKIIYFLLGVAFLVPTNLYAQNEDQFKIIKDYKRSLLIYSTSQEGYVPHAYNTPYKDNVASFIVDLQEHRGLTLRLCVQPETALFINQEIVGARESAGCFMLDMDSLYNAYKKETLFVSVYNKDLNIQNTTIQVGSIHSDQEAYEQQNLGMVDIIPRELSTFDDFYIVGLLLIMSIFAMLKAAYPKIFHEFYHISKALSFRWREDSIIAGRPISSVNMLFLMVYSFVMAFIVLALWYATGGPPQQLALISYSGFYASLISWLSLTVLIFLLLIVKYIIIWLTSSLLDFKELISFHFLDFVRISQLFLLILLAVITLSIISFNNIIPLDSRIFAYIIFLCIFSTIALLFFKLLSASSHRNIRLFSYLCTTEIFPLIIGMKFFINL